jgi:cell division protein FtsB
VLSARTQGRADFSPLPAECHHLLAENQPLLPESSTTERSYPVKARSVPQLHRKNPLRWLLLGLLIMLIILQYRWWLGENSWVDVNRLESDIASQESINADRRARNDALAARVADLKSGLDAVEELGRSDLGLVKPGEIFYVIPAE